jgi:hypothetical protein
MHTIKVFCWVRPKPFCQLVARFLLSAACLVTGTTFAYLTDNGIHPPPFTGSASDLDYNLFKPGAAGFPNIGGTYADPIFGSVVRRLTNYTGSANEDDIYAHHWANADGTYAFTHNSSKGRPNTNIIQISTGAIVYSDQPDGSSRADNAWDAIDPDKYYYFNGSNLVRRSLSAQADTTIKNFGATLEPLGGSLNFQDRSGRYFIVKFGGFGRVWDSQTNTLYTGNIPPADAAGWFSITPDAKYVVTAAGPGNTHYSYAIDHVNGTINTTGVMFWTLCGDHGVLISATDGKNYMVTFNCNNETAIYRVDITLDQTGKSASQQAAANQRLLTTTNNDGAHFTAVSKGPLRDWAFISLESNADGFNSGVGGWYAYKQEILAVNVVTMEVRRLAHHRSRGLPGVYETQPRVSCSWDGSVVMWVSNFNINSPSGYADLYAIQSPLGPGSGQIPAPQNLRFK